MEALIAIGLALLVHGFGIWIGWQLGESDRQGLADRLERTEEQIRRAYAAVEAGRKIADALAESDPRARVRGLLDAGRQGPAAPRPNGGAGGAGDGLDLLGGDGHPPGGGPGADPT